MDRIVVDPKIHFGKPCIAGTRITVQSVLELLGEGLSFNEIIRDYYPELTVEDIKACVQSDVTLNTKRCAQGIRKGSLTLHGGRISESVRGCGTRWSQVQKASGQVN